MNSELIHEENKEFRLKTINQVPNSVEIQDEIGIQNKHQILQ